MNSNQEIKINTSSSEELTPEPKYEGKNTTILNKIIKWCIYALVALLPLWFLPFTENVLGLNKQALMIGLLTIALIAWLGKLLTQDKFRWYRGKIVVFFLAFILIYGLATAFSLRPHDSLMGFDTHLDRAFINIIYFFILFILLINYYNEESEKEKNIEIFKLLTILLASSLIVGLFGFLQILGKFIFPWNFAKVTSFNTVGTPTSLGIYLVVLLPLILSLLLGAKQGKNEKGSIITGFKVFLALLALLALIIVLLLNSRTLWIITAVGMIMVIGFWLSKRYVLPAQVTAWLLIPIIILAFCLIFLFLKPGVLFDLNLPIEVGLSYKGGINIAKEVIKQSPVLGTGPGTFIYNYSLYKPESINQTIFWNFRFANAPAGLLNLISEIGILGLLAFLVMVVIFSIKTLRGLLVSNEINSGRLVGVKIGLFCGWASLMIGWFLYPQNTALMFVFWLFFAFLIILSSEKKDVKIINLRTSEKIASLVSFGFIILMIIVIGFLYLGGSKFIAEAKFKKGLDLLNKGELDSSINKVIRATITNPYEDKFYRNLAQLFLLKINQDLTDSSLNQEERANRVQVGISNAINSAVRTTTLNSKDVANWIIRGSVYRNLLALVNGAGDWAIKSYEEALKLEPSNPFIYTEIARIYVNTADLLRDQAQDNQAIKNQIIDYLNKAVEVYENAIKLKPNYAPAHFEIALVYDRQGKVNEAIARMENTLSLAPRDIGVTFQLGVLYYKTSQFDKAKAAFIRAVSLDPNYSNARYFLGLLLDREGNKEAAIEQFEKIAELNPDNDLVKQILANLKAGKPALGSSELGPPEQPEEIPLEEKQPEESRFRLPSSK